MARLPVVGLIILFSLSLLFGQSRRVPNYSESSSAKDKSELKRTLPQRSETAKEQKSDGDVIRVDTDLVVVSTQISSREGKPVSGLRKEEFTIFEDGIEQEVAYFSNEEQPFTVALVLDMSYSSVFKLKEIQTAALEFVNQLRQQDRVMVVSFNEKARVLCEPTSDRKILRLAIEGTKIASGTSLYSALELALKEKFKSVSRRKAVIVLSDGVDTTSQNATAENILQSVGESDALVYPIQYDTYDDVQKSRTSKGGITRSGNASPDLSEKHYRFQRAIAVARNLFVFILASL